MSTTPKGGASNAVAQYKSTPQKIRILNDGLRKEPDEKNVFISLEVARLGEIKLKELFAKLKSYTNFSKELDPDRDHSSGVINLDKHKIDWNISYWDLDEEDDSPDPSDPAVTTRVLNLFIV